MTGRAAHLKPVADALDRIVEAGIDDFDPPNGRRGGGGPMKAMPDDCPVEPAGTQGGVFYFLDALGQLRDLTSDKIANKHIQGLFAPFTDYLEQTWPKRKLVAARDPEGKPLKDSDDNTIMEWIVTGWDTDLVTKLLMDVAGQKGVWDPREKVRGRGAWLGDDGGLILHCGNHVLIGGRWEKPGSYDGLVYPSMPAIPKPSNDPNISGEDLLPMLVGDLRARGVAIPADASPAVVLLELLKTWNWERPLIDPILLLGWIVAAMIGGALDYRPLAWITGDRATGKTWLQKLIGWLFDGGILQSPDASEAGVRQVLGQQSLPVGIDEGEPDDTGSRKMLGLVKLARLAASSQGNVLRGGQDHKGHEFQVTSCFLFSSILVPPIPPADRSRLAVLELNKLRTKADGGLGAPRMDKREIQALGRWLMRRMADRWGEWAEMLEMFTAALEGEGGQGGRAADQFGTLIAAYTLAVHEGAPEAEEVSAWGVTLGLEALSETAGAMEEGDLCLDKLTTQTPAMQGHGMPKSIAEWIAQATAPPIAPSFGPLPDIDDPGDAGRKTARQVLDRFGMRPTSSRGRDYLAIATSHEGLAKLFEGTRWASGVWSQALGRIDGAVKDQPRHISYKNRKCTLVPIERVMTIAPEDEVAEDEVAEDEVAEDEVAEDELDAGAVL